MLKIANWMRSRKISRRWLMLIGFVISCGISRAVLASSIYVTHVAFWNYLRSGIAFVAGFIAAAIAFFATWILASGRYRWLGVALSLGASPFLFAGLFVFLFICSCQFDDRPRVGPLGESEVQIGSSRIYQDYWGDQGALGDGGYALYQETPSIGPFVRRLMICKANYPDKYSLTFSLVAPQTIRCVENRAPRDVVIED